MSDDLASVDCPDCQLQLLQQQQQIQNGNPPVSTTTEPTAPTLTPSHLLDPSSRNASSETNNFSLLGKSAYSQVDTSGPSHYQFAGIQGVRAPSTFSYGGGDLSTVSSPLHQSLQPCGTSSTTSSHTEALNFGHGTGIEACDYGFCSTCAVLEIPQNDKYYHHRANSRPPHVFPPIFYSQSHSSVIPGFPSSLTDWTNEYQHYAYPVSFSQATPPVAPTPPNVDFYTSQTTSHGQIPTGNSFTSFDAYNTATQNHGMLQQNYSQQQRNLSEVATVTGDCVPSVREIQGPSTSSCNSIVSTPREIASSNSVSVSPHLFPQSNSKKNEIGISLKEKSTPEVLVQSPAASLPKSSSSSSAEVSEGDSSDSESDSDSNSSIASEDRELISVVEEDDDETQSNREVNSGGKCLVCQNPIEITDCSSPQLAKILENIEDDIDLDITVSSGDIEIGGADEELHHHKKRIHSGPGILSISRLAMLMGLSSKAAFGIEGIGTDNDIAILCFRCGKLASLSDSLERQLISAVQTLQQYLVVPQSNQHSPEPTTSLHQSQIPQKYFIIEKSVFDPGPSTDAHLISIRQNHVEVQTVFEGRSVGVQVPKHSPHPEEIDAACQHTEEVASSSSQGVQVPSPLPYPKEIDVACQHSPGEVPYASEGVQVPSPFPFPKEMDVACQYSPEEVVTYASKEEQGLSPLPYPRQRDVNCQCSPEEIDPDASQSDKENSSSESQDNECSNAPNSVSPLSGSPEINIHPRDIQMDNVIKTENVPTSSFQNLKIDNSTRSSNSPTDTHIESVDEMAQERKVTIIQKRGHACPGCKRYFRFKSNLKAHSHICQSKEEVAKRALNPEEMKCEKCGLAFRTLYRQQRHAKLGCKGVFSCTICSKKFAKASELSAHNNIHSGDKPFKCEICGASFSTKGNQIAHSKIHLEGRRYQCTQCDKAFNRRFALTVHLNRHNGLKPFSCKLCSESFPDPSYLHKHKKKFHAQKDKDR